MHSWRLESECLRLRKFVSQNFWTRQKPLELDTVLSARYLHSTGLQNAQHSLEDRRHDDLDIYSSCSNQKVTIEITKEHLQMIYSQMVEQAVYTNDHSTKHVASIRKWVCSEEEPKMSVGRSRCLSLDQTLLSRSDAPVTRLLTSSNVDLFWWDGSTLSYFDFFASAGVCFEALDRALWFSVGKSRFIYAWLADRLQEAGEVEIGRDWLPWQHRWTKTKII